MRICVLVSSYEGSGSPFKDLDPLMDPSPWLAGHDVTLVPLRKAEADARIEALAAEGYDVFINLCDGMHDEDTAGVEVVLALERLNLAFTGAGSDCYDLNKTRVKEHLRRIDVPTPAGVVALGDADVEEAARSLRFPLIVKHPLGYCSVGMTRDSRVVDPGALRREARRMLGRFGGVLIEEFIEGQEATVLVVEDADDPGRPRVFEPALYIFPPGETFKHEAVKWQTFADGHFSRCADPALSARLKALTARSFVHLGFRGYARCDFRIDKGGVAYLLECNTNCGIFYPAYTAGGADAILLWEPAGYRELLDLLFRAAQARRAEPEGARRRSPPDIVSRGQGQAARGHDGPP